MKKLPDLPAGFTPAFLSELLHDDGVLPSGSSVLTVTREQVGDGTGMMAELSRLLVTYEGDPGQAPASFIAKYASQNETNRGIALSYNLYERESRFISELDPQTSARTPKAYYSGRDGDRLLILMEDMTDYQVGSQVEGATLRQSELAVDELAKLHAAFWQRVDQLDWVPGIAHSYHAENMHSLAQVGIDGVIEKFGDYLTPRMVQERDRFLAAIPEMQDWMISEPVTLVHGDYRMENLLYGCEPGHDPVAVIDWQGPLVARGMNDVALFLGQSTRTDVRREHERALIDRYVEGLKAGGVPAADLVDAWEDYRRTLMYNWVYVAVVAGTLDASNETAYAWMAQMVARQSAASEDLDILELMP